MHFLITAGPTREALDPVRYLSNRSSGRMGYALAGAALRAGHEVTLVTGPVSLPPQDGVRVIKITSAGEMYDAVRQCLPRCDAAIFAAAVADYRPATVAPQKIKKSGDTLTLVLERTPDILGSVRGVFQWHGFLTGFAAETENLMENARGKLQHKGCDLVVANDVSRPETGFDSKDNEVTLVWRDGRVEPLPRLAKEDLANRLIARITAAAAGRH